MSVCVLLAHWEHVLVGAVFHDEIFNWSEIGGRRSRSSFWRPARQAQGASKPRRRRSPMPAATRHPASFPAAPKICASMSATRSTSTTTNTTSPTKTAASLQRQAAWLQKYPSVRVTVEGHCDERGTREYNLALGARRANAVKEYLVSLGVSSAASTRSPTARNVRSARNPTEVAGRRTAAA